MLRYRVKVGPRVVRRAHTRDAAAAAARKLDGSSRLAVTVEHRSDGRDDVWEALPREEWESVQPTSRSVYWAVRLPAGTSAQLEELRRPGETDSALLRRVVEAGVGSFD